MALVLDRWPALLTARLFPGNLADLDLDRTPARLSIIAEVLLARSGAANRPCSFLMIRGATFFSIERAIDLYYPIPVNRLKTLEKALLQQAEEDRKVIYALMHPDVPLSQLVGV